LNGQIRLVCDLATPWKHDKRGQTEQNSSCSLIISSFSRQWPFGYTISEVYALKERFWRRKPGLDWNLAKTHSRRALTMSEALRRDFQASPDAFHSIRFVCAAFGVACTAKKNLNLYGCSILMVCVCVYLQFTFLISKIQTLIYSESILLSYQSN